MVDSKASTDFQARISSLDISLFQEIPSDTNRSDKKSLLAIQNAVRNINRSYVYLEIGSHLGGSIQPYLLDPSCHRIYSIDKREVQLPDERIVNGIKYIARYPENSTQRMLDNLKRLFADLSKISCFENDASMIDSSEMPLKPDICFIDGEHTNRKVISDFRFCKSILNIDGVIIFHDEYIVAKGIDYIIKTLKKNKDRFKAYYLPYSILVVDFRNDELVYKALKPLIIKDYAPPTLLKIIKRSLPEKLKERIKFCLSFFNVVKTT